MLPVPLLVALEVLMEDTLEIVDLESLLEDSLHCEAQHEGDPICSVEVVYVGTDCKTSIFLCKNSVDGKYGYP